MTDATASFVRDTPSPDLAPPPGTVGTGAFLRQRFFGNVAHEPADAHRARAHRLAPARPRALSHRRCGVVRAGRRRLSRARRGRVLGVYLAQAAVLHIRLLPGGAALARVDRHDRRGGARRMAVATECTAPQPRGPAVLRSLSGRLDHTPPRLDASRLADRLHGPVGRHFRLAPRRRGRNGRVLARRHPARAGPSLAHARGAGAFRRLHRVRARACR